MIETFLVQGKQYRKQYDNANFELAVYFFNSVEIRWDKLIAIYPDNCLYLADGTKVGNIVIRGEYYDFAPLIPFATSYDFSTPKLSADSYLSFIDRLIVGFINREIYLLS